MADQTSKRVIVFQLDIDDTSLSTELGKVTGRLKDAKDLQKGLIEELDKTRRGTAEYDKLAKKVGDNEQVIKKLQVAAKQTQAALELKNSVPGSYNELKNSISLTRQELNNLQIGSEAFIAKQDQLNSLLKKEVDLRKQQPSLLQTRITQGINEADITKIQAEAYEKFGKAAKAGTEIGNLLTGALGIQSEAMEKLTGSVTAGFEILKGYKDIVEANVLSNKLNAAAHEANTVALEAETVAQEELNTAEKASTGIIALAVAALGALVFALKDYFTETDKTKDVVDKAKEAEKEHIDILKIKEEAYADATLEQIKAQEIQIKNILKSLGYDQDYADEKHKITMGTIEDYEALDQAQKDSLKQQGEQLSESIKNGNFEKVSQLQSELVILEKRKTELLKKQKEIDDKLKEQREKDREQKRQDDAKALTDYLSARKQSLDQVLAQTQQDASAAEVVEKQRLADKTITQQQYEDNIRQVKLKALQDQLLDVQFQGTNLVNQEQMIADLKIKIANEEADAKIAANKRQADEAIKLAQMEDTLNQAKLDLLGVYVSGVKGLLSQDEKNRKRFGDTIKALTVAEMTINLHKELSAIAAYSAAQPANIVTAGAFGATLEGLQTAIAVSKYALGVASVLSQGFYKGGYTGGGNPREESNALGAKPYIYHKDEYVVPSSVLHTTEGAYHVKRLEQMRKGFGPRFIGLPGYADGGFANRALIAKVDSSAIMASFVKAISMMPKPIVLVEDIISAQNTKYDVESKAII